MNIIIFTDGASRGNPGPGGYGVLLKSGKYRRELSQGYRLTTNNRMELLAVIIGLETLKISNSNVKIYSDSRYVVDSVEKGWVFKWEKKLYKNKKNIDLWKRFLKIYREHKVEMQWIKAHANIPENEICDRLAIKASKQEKLMTDEAYEKRKNTIILI